MKRILIVEDDGALRSDMAAAVFEWGYDVRVAANALQGYRLVEEWRPHLVLSDINMPNLSGFDLRRGIKNMEIDHSDMAFLFVSSQPAQKNKAACLEAGADDYIVKPFSYGVLRDKIEAQLMLKKQDARAKEVSTGPLTRLLAKCMR